MVVRRAAGACCIYAARERERSRRRLRWRDRRLWRLEREVLEDDGEVLGRLVRLRGRLLRRGWRREEEEAEVELDEGSDVGFGGGSFGGGGGRPFDPSRWA
jgi:hypothetical protein